VNETGSRADRTIPIWIRLVLAGSGLTQIAFGLTLMADPAAIERVWPWPLTELSSRLLAASTLVSVPLALLPAAANRFSIARIPYFMMLTYRVLQLAAGALHYGRFDPAAPPTWNYFGGGLFMLLVIAYALFRGPHLGHEATAPPGWLPADGPLALGRVATLILDSIGVVFLALGLVFLVVGSQAAVAWIEPSGRLTSLTARLFASPLTGLAVGILLIVRSARWHEVLVPAIGLATFGLSGTLALLAGRDGVSIASPAGWVIAFTPLVLLGVGLYVLAPARRRSAISSAPLAT
jgi:hypothetical protein